MSADISVPFAYGFEGPEKRLEIVFKKDSHNHRNLFEVTTEQWQALLDEAKCTILNSIQNPNCVCYVLSESSLFVFSHKIMLKTCGTTTLLRAVPVLLSYAKVLGLHVDFVWFSHKNYSFPDKQKFPHCSIQEETDYLNQFFDGHNYVLGPLNGDHFYLYLADYRGKNEVTEHEELDATMEVLMHDIHPDVAKQFTRTEDFVDAKTTTKVSGIASLIPDSLIDDFMFDPCGYSMNGLKGQVYWTIHITPESHCSYISFETNISKRNKIGYQQLLQKVVDTFKPGRFVATLFTDIRSMDEGGCCSKTLPKKMAGGYSVVARTNMDFADAHYTLSMATYTTPDSANALKERKKAYIAHLQQQQLKQNKLSMLIAGGDNDSLPVVVTKSITSVPDSEVDQQQYGVVSPSTVSVTTPGVVHQIF